MLILFIFSIFFFITNHKSKDFIQFQCWCWIPFNNFIIILLVYGLFWICIIINLLIILKTRNFLKKELIKYQVEDINLYHNPKHSNIHSATRSTISNSLILDQNSNECSNVKKIKKVLQKLKFYPLVTIIIWSIASINRGYEFMYYRYFSDIDEVPKIYTIIKLILFTCQSVAMSSRGLIYMAIYFGKYEKVNKPFIKFWVYITNCLCCSNKKKRNEIMRRYSSDTF